VAESVQSIRPDIGNTWFVTFSNEEAAMDALDHIRGKQLGEQPVAARLKSENPLKML
jgi:hypothetical protein